MTLSRGEIGYLLVGVAFIFLGGYAAISRTGDPGTGLNNKAPESEGKADRSLASASANLGLQSMSANVNMLGLDATAGLTQESKLTHFFDPGSGMVHINSANLQYTDCKHRYPTVSGTNISTLIHKGYSPLMVPSPRDNNWFWNPPGEDMFGG